MTDIYARFCAGVIPARLQEAMKHGLDLKGMMAIMVARNEEREQLISLLTSALTTASFDTIITSDDVTIKVFHYDWAQKADILLKEILNAEKNNPL